MKPQQRTTLNTFRRATRRACSQPKLSLMPVVMSIFLSASIASADQFTVGELIIDEVYTYATPPGAQSAGGYLTITNTGSDDDTLIGGSSSFSSVTQVHEMKMVDNMMKMRHLEKGLTIPAGQSVQLEPGGLHMMFMQLTQSLKDGEVVNGSLTFTNAGDVAVQFKVIDRRKQMSGKNHDESHGMKHGEMKQDKMKQDKMKHSPEHQPKE